MKRILSAKCPLYLQVLFFFTALLGGAMLWLGILALCSPAIWMTFIQGFAVPRFWQNLYLTGLYVWICLLLLWMRRLRGESWQDWGLSFQGGASFLMGWMCGALFVLSLRGLSILQGIPFLPLVLPSLTVWVKYVLVSMAIANAFALVEEVLFRGFFLRLLLAYGPLKALWIQALCFSFVHGESWQHTSVALNLSFIGCILGVLRLICGHLGWSLGLHSGWVFAVGILARLQGLNTLQGIWNPLRSPMLTLCFIAILIGLWSRFKLAIHDVKSLSMS